MDTLKIYRDTLGTYRIGWYLKEEQDFGISLGQDLDTIKNCEEQDHKAATEAIMSLGAESDIEGFYWESKAKVSAALAVAKQAAKNALNDKPWPTWTNQALAAGWKHPKNWKPQSEVYKMSSM